MSNYIYFTVYVYTLVNKTTMHIVTVLPVMEMQNNMSTYYRYNNIIAAVYLFLKSFKNSTKNIKLKLC